MLRLAFLIIVIGTLIGALMPVGEKSPPTGTASGNDITASPLREPVAEPQLAQNGEVILNRSADGHFYADASVNGAAVRFMVDTGATVIALTKSDAMRASIALTPGLVDVVGKGASGDVRGELVTLDRVELGHKQASGIAGVVIEGGEQSLLGQTFLSRFNSVEIRGDKMVLR